MNGFKNRNNFFIKKMMNFYWITTKFLSLPKNYLISAFIKNINLKKIFFLGLWCHEINSKHI